MMLLNFMTLLKTKIDVFWKLGRKFCLIELNHERLEEIGMRYISVFRLD